MKNSDFINKIKDSRLFWIIVSLVASLFIWIYVTSVQTDLYTQLFKSVRVEVVGEDRLLDSKNLVVTDIDSATVSFEITGPRRILASLKSSDLVARIDVSKLSHSAYTSLQYDVVFPDKTDTTNLIINSRSPDSISFMVSQQTSKTVEVKGSFNGETADGFSAEMPVFEPSSITIYGPEAYLKNISYAWVTFGSGIINSSYSVDTGFLLKDENDQDCPATGLSFSSDTVTATLPILLVKDVPIGINLVYGAGATEENTKVTVFPESVTLAGDTSILSGLNKVNLPTIDLSDFNSTFSESYPIIIDDELKNLTGITEAEVTVEIVGLESRTFNIDNFSYINVTEGYTCDILTQNLTVTLRGNPDSLDLIGSQNLRAVADLKDYENSVGQYLPAVKIYIDGFTDVGEIGSYTISVDLRKQS